MAAPCCATCACRTSTTTRRIHVPAPGAVEGQDTLVLGQFLRDVAELNQDQRNFRVFGPDETLSNLLGAVFEVTTTGSGTRGRSRTTNSSRPQGECSTRC